MKKKIGLLTITTALLLSLSACSFVTKEQLRQVQADSQHALVTAKEAKDIALATDERARNTEVVVNRSFKKSMYK